MLECKTLAETNKGGVVDFPLHIWWMEPQTDTTEHRHSFVEIVLILRGNSEHFFEGKRQAILQGDVFVIPPGVAHFYKNSSADFSLVNVIFSVDQLPIPLIDVPLLPGFDALLQGRKSELEGLPFAHLEEEDFKWVRTLLERLREEDNTRRPGYRFSMLGTFMMFLVDLARIISSNQGRNPEVFLYVSGVIAYLKSHFRETCSLSKLCHVAGMSRATLQRKFLNATGTSPRQYQIQLRIAEATAMLRSSDKTVDDIAAELGFGNRNYFSRQFRKITGCSPIQFRKNGSAEARELAGNGK